MLLAQPQELLPVWGEIVSYLSLFAAKRDTQLKIGRCCGNKLVWSCPTVESQRKYSDILQIAIVSCLCDLHIWFESLCSIFVSSPCFPLCVTNRCSMYQTCSSPEWSQPLPCPPPSRRSCSLHLTSLRGTTTTTWCEKGNATSSCDRGANQRAAHL